MHTHTATHIHCSFNSYFIYLMKLRHVEFGTLQTQGGGVGRMESVKFLRMFVQIFFFLGVPKCISVNLICTGLCGILKFWSHIKCWKNANISTDRVGTSTVQRQNSCVAVSFAVFIFPCGSVTTIRSSTFPPPPATNIAGFLFRFIRLRSKTWEWTYVIYNNIYAPLLPTLAPARNKKYEIHKFWSKKDKSIKYLCYK